MKRTFTYSTEWSDWSEHSPHTVGQLPDIVELPDGDRVQLWPPDERFQRPTRTGYFQIHPDVRVRTLNWGDNGTRRMGRAGGKMEVLAPKGSTFLFQTRCQLCGNEMGYVPESELTPNHRAPERWHPRCRAEYEQQVG